LLQQKEPIICEKLGEKQKPVPDVKTEDTSTKSQNSPVIKPPQSSKLDLLQKPIPFSVSHNPLQDALVAALLNNQSINPLLSINPLFQFSLPQLQLNQWIGQAPSISLPFQNPVVSNLGIFNNNQNAYISLAKVNELLEKKYLLERLQQLTGRNHQNAAFSQF